MKSPQQIADLIFKHLRNELTEAERIELNEWRQESPENQEKFTKLTDPQHLQALMQDFYSYKEKAWNKLLEKVPELRKASLHIQRRTWWRWPAVAAAILVIIGAGIYIQRQYTEKQLIAKHPNEIVNDVPPGTNMAILTLSNGSKIILDSAHTGTLTNQGNSKIVKLDSGKLAYQTTNIGQQSTVVQFNTLSTPRGGQFQLVLPDGSRLWLNAATTLRFPTSFEGKERKVELSGEAYMEVSKDPSRPFKVRINHGNQEQAEVEVLGTHFNIMADTDEASVAATLLEGRIKIIMGGTEKTIQPGEQAKIMNHSDQIQIIKNIDLSAVVAWKNGRTFFKNADTRSIMRMISRWYDVDVVYQGKVPEGGITGGVSRNANLSDLLKVLEHNNIHVTMEGKKLTVMP
jgi:ferric-dicitrate binding protein FerR (iron transport regulator)